MFYIRCRNFLVSLALLLLQLQPDDNIIHYFLLLGFLQAWLSLTAARYIHCIQDYMYSISRTIAQTREICKYPIEDQHWKWHKTTDKQAWDSEKSIFGLTRMTCTFHSTFVGWRVFSCSSNFKRFEMMRWPYNKIKFFPPIEQHAHFAQCTEGWRMYTTSIVVDHLNIYDAFNISGLVPVSFVIFWIYVCLNWHFNDAL